MFVDLVQSWKRRFSPKKDLAIILLDIILSFVMGSFFSLVVQAFTFLSLLMNLINGPIVDTTTGLFGFIDNFAHIGGLITGVLASALILPVHTKNRKSQVIKWVIMFLSFGLILGGIFIGGLIGFYRGTLIGSCQGCKYLSCVPIIGQCDSIWSQFSDY